MCTYVGKLLFILAFSSLLACGGKVQIEDDPEDKNFCKGKYLTNSPYADGDGSSSNPYLICTAEQLNHIGKNKSNWSSSFQLKADIDLSSYDGSSSEKTFSQIGNFSTAEPFTGTFDGNQHTISNYVFPSTAASTLSASFIGYHKGTIENIIFENDLIDGANQTYIGVVVGYSENGILKNVIVKNSAVSGASSTGAIAGIIDGGSIESSAGINNSVVGDGQVGGVIGSIINGTATKIYSSGSVSGSDAIGGLIGVMDMGTTSLSHSYSESTVTASNNMAGGIVGSAGFPSGTGTHTVTNCFATGSVTAAYRAGGAIGLSLGATVSNIYASGNVDSPQIAGGLIAQIWTGSLSNSYTTSTVTGSSLVGGAVGSVIISAAITNTYFTDDSNNSKGTQSLNDTATARSNATAGWDFTTIWQYIGNSANPSLQN